MNENKFYDDKTKMVVLGQLLAMSKSVTIEQKTVLRDIIRKYAKCLDGSNGQDIRHGRSFLRLKPTESTDNLRKRRDDLDKLLREYYKKENTKAFYVLHLNDDDKHDVWLYIEEREKYFACKADNQITGKPEESVEKVSTQDIVVYNADVRLNFKNNFLFKISFIFLLVLIWVIAIVLLFVSGQHISLRKIMEAQVPFLAIIEFSVGLLLVFIGLHLYRFLKVNFICLVGRLFLKQTKDEITIASYSGSCPICGNPVELKNINLLKNVNVGKCQSESHEETFTFSHKDLSGRLIKKSEGKS
jgi:hypothetical protein